MTWVQNTLRSASPNTILPVQPVGEIWQLSTEQRAFSFLAPFLWSSFLQNTFQAPSLSIFHCMAKLKTVAYSANNGYRFLQTFNQFQGVFTVLIFFQDDDDNFCFYCSCDVLYTVSCHWVAGGYEKWQKNSKIHK